MFKIIGWFWVNYRHFKLSHDFYKLLKFKCWQHLLKSLTFSNYFVVDKNVQFLKLIIGNIKEGFLQILHTVAKKTKNI